MVEEDSQVEEGSVGHYFLLRPLVTLVIGDCWVNASAYLWNDPCVLLGVPLGNIVLRQHPGKTFGDTMLDF